MAARVAHGSGRRGAVTVTDGYIGYDGYVRYIGYMGYVGYGRYVKDADCARGA
jgi:hypothetical protein